MRRYQIKRVWKLIKNKINKIYHFWNEEFKQLRLLKNFTWNNLGSLDDELIKSNNYRFLFNKILSKLIVTFKIIKINFWEGTCFLIWIWLFSKYIYIITTHSFVRVGAQQIKTYEIFTKILENLRLVLGWDNFSLIFLLMLLVILPFIILTQTTTVTIYKNLHWITILSTFIIVWIAFSTLNLFFFFICFEISLIPMFFLIGLDSSKKRKIKALYYFIFFALFGSLLLLLAIFIIYNEIFTTNVFLISFNQIISFEKQKLIWLLIFISFATKVPMWPFHLWLPEAHVEAPTTGSIILASILLKLGSYGILRFNYLNFFLLSKYYSPLVILLAMLSVFYATMYAMIQIDFKKVIAYFSIVHMNLAIIGLFSFTYEGLCGFILSMFSHSISAGGLFYLAGILQKRFNTKIFLYYKNIMQQMPKFTFYLFLFLLANMSFPLTANFIGEILIYAGLVKISFFLFFFTLIPFIFSGIYNIILFIRICFTESKKKLKLKDLTKKEELPLRYLLVLLFFFGIYPNFLLNFLKIYLLFF